MRIAVLDGHIPLVQERVYQFEAVRHLHGVAGIDFRGGVFLGLGKQVKFFFLCKGVQRAFEGSVRKGCGEYGVPLGEPCAQACCAINLHTYRLCCHRSGDCQRNHYF